MKPLWAGVAESRESEGISALLVHRTSCSSIFNVYAVGLGGASHQSRSLPVEVIERSIMSTPENQEPIPRAKDILAHCGIEDNKIDESLKELEAELQRLQAIGSPEQRLINDAIHGPVKLTSLAFKIVNTPEFHRLKDIKQLGGSNYVYPGANHTRFDHSIGVYHLAGEFARHLQKQLKLDAPDGEDDLWKFSDQEVLCVEIAGLCHDLGHGPLSHMFERHVLESLADKKLKHEDLSIEVFKRLLRNIAVLAEFVTVTEGLGVNEVKLIELMIKPKKGKPLCEQWENREFLCEIVANKHNGMDVDKWDYYSRDCHYLGFTNDFQQKRCMLLGRIVKNEETGKLHVAFRDKELDNIYGMFRTRGILHQKAYQHKTVKAVEKMISDAIIAAKDVKLLSVLDESESRVSPKMYVPKSVVDAITDAKDGKMAAYLALTDSLLGIIKNCPQSLSPHASDPTPANSDLQQEAAALEEEQEQHQPQQQQRGGDGDADEGEVIKPPLERAKNLLRRVETRDLYSCSGKIRIPKMDKNGQLWRAMLGMEVQPEGEAIYNFLDANTKTRISLKDLWIEFEVIRVPSEGEDDPVNKVLFYKKPEGTISPTLLTLKEVEDKTSMLVVPRAFVECEVRVYDTREASRRTMEDKEQLQKALLEWKKEADKKHNGHATRPP